MTRETISRELREKVLKRDKYRCRYCGTYEPPFHLDHVYPVIRGGETSMENLVTSCARCNQRKHTSLEWPVPNDYFDRPPLPEFGNIVVRRFLSSLIGWTGVFVSAWGLYALHLFMMHDPLGKLAVYLLSTGPFLAFCGFVWMCMTRDEMLDYYRRNGL